MVATSFGLGAAACGSSQNTNITTSTTSRAISPGLTAVLTPAPLYSFSLPDLDGQTVHSNDFLGSVLILRFWATW